MDIFLDFGDVADTVFGATGDFFSEMGNFFSGAPLETPAPEMPSAPTPPVEPPPVEAPAPVQAPEPVQPPTETLAQTIKSEFEKGEQNFRQWVQNLKAEDRMMVGRFLQQGAAAALAAAQGKERMAFERGKEDRAREDKIRRGAVSAMPAGAFAPKPVRGGLIDSAGG